MSRDRAWREGRLAFDDEPHSGTEILISPDLKNQTVTGLFVFNDPVGSGPSPSRATCNWN
jgi:ferric-dicitrate binding protein FerR (iron transport regulator)